MILQSPRKTLKMMKVHLERSIVILKCTGSLVSETLYDLYCKHATKAGPLKQGYITTFNVINYLQSLITMQWMLKALKRMPCRRREGC